MSDKYPVDLIEKVAEALHYGLRRDDFGVANEDEREEVSALAVAALDALGIIVTEEWRGYEGAPVVGSRAWAQYVVADGAPVQMRNVILIAMPWMEVTDDAE